MAASGATVVDVGELPTPALYFGVHALALDGGVQVTGSHNPPEFNGFKMVLAGDSVHGDDIQDLYERITLERSPARDGRETADGSVLERYRDAIVSRHTLARPVRVVVDCGNGVGSVIAVSTLRALGAEVVPLFCDSDGTFPNHHPDPTVPANLVDLQVEVRRTGAELGIAFDGDADRIGAVDENARVLFGDQLLVVFGRDAVRRFGPGARVIFDVKCSDLLPTALRAAGAEPEMWKTGHSLIKARMKEQHAVLAGEMSGHMFFGGRLVRVRRCAVRGRAASRNRVARPGRPGVATWRICRSPSPRRKSGWIAPTTASLGSSRKPRRTSVHATP